MARTITADFSVVYDTLAEYEEAVANIANFEADLANHEVTNKVFNEAELTISLTFVITE